MKSQIDLFDEIIVANFPEWHGAKKLTTMAELDAAVAV